MTELVLEDFNEVAWNDRRLELEDAVINSVLELSNYMGSTQFQLTEDETNITVKVNPCDV
jgi:hypothetical protein